MLLCAPLVFRSGELRKVAKPKNPTGSAGCWCWLLFCSPCGSNMADPSNPADNLTNEVPDSTEGEKLSKKCVHVCSVIVLTLPKVS